MIDLGTGNNNKMCVHLHILPALVDHGYHQKLGYG